MKNEKDILGFELWTFDFINDSETNELWFRLYLFIIDDMFPNQFFSISKEKSWNCCINWKNKAATSLK